MIKVNRLTKLYSNKRGISNISFEIKKGDILGLLGPNGSGKTTIMKTMLSTIHEDSGSVVIDGKDIRENFEEIMKKIGALVEAPAIYKDLTAYQNMYLAAKNPMERNDIDKKLAMVHLEKYRNDKAGRFSLGMKQRLGLAQAFLGKPEIIILDEPVNGLDIEGVVEIREIIGEMNRQFGTTFIISSHIAIEIEKVCNKAAVIHEGELVAFEEMEKILALYPSLEEYFLEKVRERRGSI